MQIHHHILGRIVLYSNTEAICNLQQRAGVPSFSILDYDRRSTTSRVVDYYQACFGIYAGRHMRITWLITFAVGNGPQEFLISKAHRSAYIMTVFTGRCNYRRMPSRVAVSLPATTYKPSQVPEDRSA